MEQMITANWKEGMHFEINALGGMVDTDAADDFGGKGKGIRAKSLMLSAIAGCTGIDVLSIINKMRIELNDFYIEVKGNLTEDHPKIFDTVHISYYFVGNDLDEEKIIKAVNLSFDKYCGVIAMFKKFATVTKEINFAAA